MKIRVILSEVRSLNVTRLGNKRDLALRLRAAGREGAMVETFLSAEEALESDAETFYAKVGTPEKFDMLW